VRFALANRERLDGSIKKAPLRPPLITLEHHSVNNRNAKRTHKDICMGHSRSFPGKELKFSPGGARIAEEIKRWLAEAAFPRPAGDETAEEPAPAYKGFGYDVSEGKLVTNDPQTSLRWGEFVRRLSETVR
jgi:hypothetical protein